MADGGVSGLLISAAINIAIGVALSALFGPPDSTVEGPRLSQSPFTAAPYGQPVNMLFGTDRLSGAVIDITDPPLEEVVSEEDLGGKGFFGPTVTTRSYSYFVTMDLSFGIEGIENVIKIIADHGKLIADRDPSSLTFADAFVAFLGVKSGQGGPGEILFYPGGPTQMPDPEEMERRGPQIPAYRHLSRIKFNHWPVADYGNRVPTIEAILTTNALVSTPFLSVDPEPTGFNPPGSLSGSNAGGFVVDPFKSLVYEHKSGTKGIAAINLGDMSFRNFISDGSAAGTGPIVGLDGHAYLQFAEANSSPLRKYDMETGDQVGILGGTSIGLTDTSAGGNVLYGSSGRWYQLQNPAAQDLLVQATSLTGAPNTSMILHMNNFGTANGSLTLSTNINIAFGGSTAGMQLRYIWTLSTADGFETMSGLAIPDHDRGVYYVVTSADSGATFQIMKIQFSSLFSDDDQGFSSLPSFTELRRFTRGNPGDDFETSSAIAGWAVNRGTGQLILSNGDSMLLYDPDSDTILENRQDLGFSGEHNYYSSTMFAFPHTSLTLASTIYVIDTRTLETTRTIDVTDVGMTGNNIMFDGSSVWDDITRSIIVSRVNSGSSAPNGQRVVKIFVDKITGGAVDLDFVVGKISTEYNRVPLGGLTDADIDVTELAGDSVLGYTLVRGTPRGMLDPLRLAYFFDAVQSDWIVKFPKRDRPSLLTIPSKDIGILQKSSTETAFAQTRVDEGQLPMRISLRYRNKDIDYNIDIEGDKRNKKPVPTMDASNERVVDVPIVSQPTTMKRVASRQLFDTWSARQNFETIIPWRYLEVDATDVVTLQKFSEDLLVRLSNIDVGADFRLSTKSVLIDAKNNASTIGGGENLGFVRAFLHAALATRLHMLDAPLLSLQDLKYAGVSNAYVAVGSYGDGWPGGVVYRSRDDQDYSVVQFTNAEVAFGKVKVPPGTWDPDKNRFQEVAEGGTVDILPIRRSSVWASATELQVLNGGNAVAIPTEAGVEVIQFQDATLNADGSVTLSRLLRGRLGTEDVTEADLMAAGNEVIFLAGPTAAPESGPILRGNLSTTDLNIFFYYKGVTVGARIEDAATVSASFSGRDLKPFAPAHVGLTPHVVGGASTADGLIVNFLRRTRGPRAGEWEDNTALVPLNETIESYDVVVTRDSDSLVVLDTTVSQEDALLPTSALASSIYLGKSDVLTNGDAETGSLTPWTGTAGWSVATLPFNNLSTPDPNFPAGSSQVFGCSIGAGQTRYLHQDVDLTALISDFTALDEGKASALFSASVGSSGTNGASGRPAMMLMAQFMDGSGGIITPGTDFDETAPDGSGPGVRMNRWHSPTQNTWVRINLHTVIPSGTRSVRLFMRCIANADLDTFGQALDENDAAVSTNVVTSTQAMDNVQMLLRHGDETYTVEVFQKSEFIGRGIAGVGAFP